MDELSSIVKRSDLHSRRYSRLECGNLFFNGLDYFTSVDSITRNDHAANCFFAILIERTSAKGIAELYICNVAHVNGYAVLRPNNNVLYICRRFNETNAPDDCPFPCLFNHIAANVMIGTLHSLNHYGKRNAVATQLVWIDINLILLHVTANTRYFRNTGNGVQLVSHVPVLQCPQVAQVHTFAFQRVPENLTYAGRIGTKRWNHTFWQLLGHEIQPFQYACSGPVQINVVFEDDINHREAECGTGANDTHAGQTLKISDQRIGHLIFYFLR